MMRVWFYNNGGIGLICLHSHYNLDICILNLTTNLLNSVAKRRGMHNYGTEAMRRGMHNYGTEAMRRGMHNYGTEAMRRGMHNYRTEAMRRGMHVGLKLDMPYTQLL